MRAWTLMQVDNSGANVSAFASHVQLALRIRVPHEEHFMADVPCMPWGFKPRLCLMTSPLAAQSSFDDQPACCLIWS